MQAPAQSVRTAVLRLPQSRRMGGVGAVDHRYVLRSTTRRQGSNCNAPTLDLIACLVHVAQFNWTWAMFIRTSPSSSVGAPTCYIWWAGAVNMGSFSTCWPAFCW